jgi:hypothetical protein
MGGGQGGQRLECGKTSDRKHHLSLPGLKTQARGATRQTQGYVQLSTSLQGEVRADCFCLWVFFWFFFFFSFLFFLPKFRQKESSQRDTGVGW